MSENSLVYSIQRTYILTPVVTPEKRIITCNQRIDIPTIDPLTDMKSIAYPDEPKTVVPCIELAGEFLSEFNLTFETNEGVTVLPVMLTPGETDILESPYINFRYVLVLPRGATGIKSCKLIHKATGKEVQNNFTFGIMPPPYNYDNALFGYLDLINSIGGVINTLKLTTTTSTIAHIELPKGEGKQTIDIKYYDLFFETQFIYPLSTEPTIHKPKITLHGIGGDLVYTLSLSRATNNVSIDLFTGMITVYAGDTGEIMQQFKIAVPDNGFETLSFENFDDIEDFLAINARGARVG